MKNLLKLGLIVLGFVMVLSLCGKKEFFDIIGWNFNDIKWGGYEKNFDYEGQ